MNHVALVLLVGLASVTRAGEGVDESSGASVSSPGIADPESGDEVLDATDLSLEDLLTASISSVSKVEESSSTSPAVVNVVTRQQIREMGYRTIYDILIHTPGFWEIQDVNDKLIGMRGIHASTNQKFLLLINGKRITENYWNLTDVDYSISLSNVRRIEIIRGPGSAVYGRAALTAVINVITDDDHRGFRFDASYGSYGYKKVGFSYADDELPIASIEVWGHFFETQGQRIEVPASDDGAANPVDGEVIIDRYKGGRWPVGSIGIRALRGDWTLNLIGITHHYKQPRGAGAQLTWQDIQQDSYYTPFYKKGLIGEEHNFLVFDLERKIEVGASEHRVSLAYTRSHARLRENTRPLRDISNFPSDWTAQDIADYQNEARLGEFFEFDIMVQRYGTEYFGRFNFDDEGRYILWGFEAYVTDPVSDKFISNYDSEIVDGSLVRVPLDGGYLREKPDGVFDRLRTEYLYSGYAEGRWRFANEIHVSLGGRYDLHVNGKDYSQEGASNRYPDPQADAKRKEVEKTNSQLSPRVAVIYQPMGDNSLTLKAIYNRSFIAPGHFYRYADPSTSYAGGPWLKAETLDSYMLAGEGVIDSFGFKALIYRNTASDLLTRDTNLVPARYDSLGQLSTEGAEIDLYFNLPQATAFANYAYMRGAKGSTDEETQADWFMDNGSVKNFPKHYGSVGLTGRLLDRQLTASVLLLWHASIESPVTAGVGAGEVTTIAPGVQADINLRWAPSMIDLLDGFELAFSIYNVLDSEILRGGTVRRPYRKAGRWSVLSVAYQL